MNSTELTSRIDDIIASKKSVYQQLKDIAKAINTYDRKFSWVGFYIMNHSTQKLHLGPYVGNPTDHTVIPFGKGICGQVAVSGETYIAEDVDEESNYIACNIDVKSEIVIPIYDEDTLVAQLDIDSNVIDAFGENESKLLHEICGKINLEMASQMHFDRFFKD